jgi:loricrin
VTLHGRVVTADDRIVPGTTTGAAPSNGARKSSKSATRGGGRESLGRGSGGGSGSGSIDGGDEVVGWGTRPGEDNAPRRPPVDFKHETGRLDDWLGGRMYAADRDGSSGGSGGSSGGGGSGGGGGGDSSHNSGDQSRRRRRRRSDASYGSSFGRQSGSGDAFDIL